MSPESTGFLNRYVDTDGHDVGALLSDLVATAGAKAAENSRLRRSSLEALDSDLEQAAQAISERFRAGACLYTFGNGASSTDAACVAALFARSPGGALLPARCLVADPAVLTANRERRRQRARLLETAGRVRARWRHCDGLLDERELGERHQGFSGDQASWPSDRRLRWMRRRSAGRIRRARPLLRRPIAQRAPDPGGPGGTEPSSMGDGAATADAGWRTTSRGPARAGR